MRLYAEESCEHERTDECGNPICRECGGPWGHRLGCSYQALGSQGTYPCPGGSRREVVVDYRAAAVEWIGEEPPDNWPGEGEQMIQTVIEQTVKAIVDAALSPTSQEGE